MVVRVLIPWLTWVTRITWKCFQNLLQSSQKHCLLQNVLLHVIYIGYSIKLKSGTHWWKWLWIHLIEDGSWRMIIWYLLWQIWTLFHVSYSMSSVVNAMLVRKTLVEVSSVHVDLMDWSVLLHVATAVVTKCQNCIPIIDCKDDERNILLDGKDGYDSLFENVFSWNS